MQNVVVFDWDHLAGMAIKSIVNKNTNFQVVAVVKFLPDLLTILETQTVDLLILDIAYDSKPNFELLSKLQEQYKSTAVVIVSSYDDYDYMRKSIQYGVQDYILKPITIGKIKELLHQHQEEPIFKSAEEMRKLVMNKDFNAVYYSMEKIRQLIQHDLEDKSQRENRIELIQNEILRLINCTDKQKQQQFLLKLNLEEVSFYEKYPAQFFLFTLFDEIYKQRTIQKKPQLALFYKYVEDHVYEDISLKETAEKCHISQGYLSRIVRENYSQGFNTYIQMKKMHLAKQGFYYNDSKIIDIAFQLSYSEPSYFCKVFKKIEKKTPHQLKKEMMKSG